MSCDGSSSVCLAIRRGQSAIHPQPVSGVGRGCDHHDPPRRTLGRGGPDSRDRAGPRPPLSCVGRRAPTPEVVASGAAYHSANPAVIRAILAQEPLQARVEEAALLDPWLWSGRLGRTYLVYALRIPRRAA